jgi:hypothetical protein
MIQVYQRLVAAISERNRWLLLIHQLPKEPAYLRVKVGRRLARIGAIALKNSVYVLPKTEAAAEDFQWTREEITAAGGEATVVEASVVSGVSDEAIESKFRAAKDTEYTALGEEVRTAQKLPTGRRKRPLTEEERAQRMTELARLELKLQDLRTTDFFGASGAESVSGLLRELRVLAEPPVPTNKPEPAEAPPTARTWVTRAGIRVDRIASAWLIKRFIDPEAQFKFVAPKGYVPGAGELRFDMAEAEYSHIGDACTFEVLCAKFNLNLPGLRPLAEIIHDIDVKDSKFERPETAGIAALINGLAVVYRQDDQRLRAGAELLEALLGHFASNKR